MSKRIGSQHAQAMIVAGIMSGTSADGVDVVLTRITQSTPSPKIKFLAHESFPYPRRLREAVLQAMDAKSITTAELARLHWRLGEVYADAAAAMFSKHGVQPQLIGCHGQTIYHQGVAKKYLGQPLRCTWQLGEASLIAAKTDVPVVSDFRPMDMAVGGQGAPLVPMLDYVLFRDEKRPRALQNLGGIGNLTAIPANAQLNDVLAFDTGPANMVIDACMKQLFGKEFDRDGRIAARGLVMQPVIDALLRDKYFIAMPPKSAGREQFGEAYTENFLRLCRKQKAKSKDIIATATALTAESIAQAYQRFAQPALGYAKADYILAGGGAHNKTLVAMLRERLAPLGCTVKRSGELGIPSQAKEAVAFALLAWLTWHQLPGNVPTATGAARPAILGKVTYV